MRTLAMQAESRSEREQAAANVLREAEEVAERAAEAEKRAAEQLHQQQEQEQLVREREGKRGSFGRALGRTLSNMFGGGGSASSSRKEREGS
jgi:hypothetical protein